MARRLLVVGGSDAGISAALRARELAPATDVTVVVADSYPNFSVCGIPYYLSGEVLDWRSLDTLGPEEGVHVLHTMDDTFALAQTLERTGVQSTVVVGAGYIGLELADAFTVRGLTVTQIEELPEVLPTVDAELGALVRAELEQVTAPAGDCLGFRWRVR